MKRNGLLYAANLFGAIVVGLFWGVGCTQATSTEIEPIADIEPASLEQVFKNVPDAHKPWCYWWWIKGNVDEQHITRDLEAMKAKGFGGLLMFDSRGYHESHVVPPPAKTDFMSPRWRELLKYSIKEANRLGLQFSINLSSDAGALKGPWTVGAEAPKRLIWTSAEAVGPKDVTCQIKRPYIGPKAPPAAAPNQPDGQWFWDIGVLAVRHEAARPDTRPAGAPIDLCGTWSAAQTKPVAGSPVLEVVDLSKQIDSTGKLTWKAPPGQWTLLRFAYTTMEGHEYDVDVLDPKAVEAHFNRFGRTILNDAGPLAGKALTHFYSVSWEGAAPTWTPALEAEFTKQRGYAIRPWLPALAGLTVKDRATSDRFLRDYHKTLGDTFMTNYYGKLHELCRDSGMRWHSESGGPWDRKLAAFEVADQFAFLARNDMPQGEFWYKGRAMNRPAAMTAHIYGKRLAATEAFTHMIQHWSAYPAMLKIDADGAFCDGSNQFVWHTFTASPPEFGKPGIEYFAGTHINPNVTWHEQAKPFIDYLGRCQLMLRQGRFVADVACYIGDAPYQHWGRGEKWSTKATLQLGKGYTYDLVTTEVLLDRMAVKNGNLVLPDGMTYRVLVVDLDDTTTSPAVLRKIGDLAKMGATIILGSRAPQRAPGLTDYPNCDTEVRDLARQLWGDTGASNVARRALGSGHVITGATKVEEVLLANAIAPDFDGPCNYSHRRVGDTDIYFVSGKARGEVKCTFRVVGKEPEIWNPATGEVREAVQYWVNREDHRAIVPLTLPENGSTFVVFRKPASPNHLANVMAPAEGTVEIAGRVAQGAQVRLWRNGAYEFQVSTGTTVKLDAAGIPDALSVGGPWSVVFEPGRGAPGKAAFDKLIAWDQHIDPGIKHFSGRATYTTTLELTEQQAKHAARLQLGQVMNVAEVKVNGKPLGIVWTDPWAVDLPAGLLHPGRNELEIAVTNTWVNRLIGDAPLPPEKRITKTNVAYEPAERKLKIYQSFSAKDKLMPSGLIGPVKVEFGKVDVVKF